MIEVSMALVLPEKPTVGDVRKWLEEAQALGVPDEQPLDDWTLTLFVDGKKAQFIECANHMPDNDDQLPKDLLVDLHGCED